MEETAGFMMEFDWNDVFDVFSCGSRNGKLEAPARWRLWKGSMAPSSHMVWATQGESQGFR